MNSYPEVCRAHIVPRCYLLNFALEEMISLVVNGTPVRRPVSIDDAAIRTWFYRRYRPDGTPIDDVEWSLSQLEGVIAPILKRVRSDWPYPGPAEKGKLAEFFGFQAVRGPRWKEWHRQKTRENMDELRANPEPIEHSGLLLPVTQRSITTLEHELLSETHWLMRMMSIANKLIDIFGSMRWTLVEFDEPMLMISDHPVTAWPLGSETQRAGPIQVDGGFLNFLEIRMPISPTLALLLTWQDLPDTIEPIQGSRDTAASLNAFTSANCEKQWMHLPETDPLLATGYLGPVSPALIDGYGDEEAEACEVRRVVTETVQPKLGEEGRESADIVSVRAQA